MSINPADSEVRIAKSIGYRIIAKKATRSVLWMMAVALIVYAIIACSMTRYVATNLGTLKIVSTNFPGGQARPDTVLAIDPTGGYDGNPLKNALTAVTPHGSIVIAKVVEGPFGSPDWAAYGIDREKDEKLTSEYLVQCLKGCDVKGSFGVIAENQIMGIPVDQ